MLSAVRLIWHSLAFADQDVRAGGEKGCGAGSLDLPVKSQVLLVYRQTSIGPPSVNSWTPWNLRKSRNIGWPLNETSFSLA